MLYKSMWQVSSGLKEDEMGSQVPQCQGGIGVKNSIFGIFRSPAPKLALVAGSRWYYNIDIWNIQVCGKCHHD